MREKWWYAFKDCRGSRPRCILLVDGTKYSVANKLTCIVSCPSVEVSEKDFWMPRGKPVYKDNKWNKEPAKEAKLNPDAQCFGLNIHQELLDWWLVTRHYRNTPSWDLASTCKIEGRKGLLLVEAKAHSNELAITGKGKPNKCSEGSRKNHEQICKAIAEANVGLKHAAGGSWRLSRDSHYQLSNRFAWSWKLASLGVPVVLVYLGFLNAREMAKDGELFQSKDKWKQTLKNHAREIVEDSCWERRLDVNGTPFIPLIRAYEQPFP